MIQKPKGTYDVYGKLSKQTKYFEKLVSSLMEKYNYEYIRTPLFESSSLFHRGVGDSTDIVTKETYDFKDKGNRDLTLRPEGTAGVVRSFIENKMYAESLLNKFWYFGPMYRYERPQAGRYREFFQFGVEAFGSLDPLMDAEVISIPVNLFKLLGLKGIKVHINTLGDMESRNNYKEALKKHFEPFLDNLCDDCKNRFNKNPLRILDCKVDNDLECMKSAPKITDYLNEISKKHFESVKKYLDSMNIEYIIDESLVRGLDYYTHTVFEVEANVEGFGSQNVLCGGGRYNDLVKTLDGPEIPGVGFALGLERLFTALDYENIDISESENIDVYIMPLCEDKSVAIKYLNIIRMNGYSADMDYLNRSMKSNFKSVEKLNPKYILIIGEDEINNNTFTLKNNENRVEYKIEQDKIIDFLDEFVGGYIDED